VRDLVALALSAACAQSCASFGDTETAERHPVDSAGGLGGAGGSDEPAGGTAGTADGGAGGSAGGWSNSPAEWDGCLPGRRLIDGRCRMQEVFFGGGTFVMGRGFCSESLLNKPDYAGLCPLQDDPHEATIAPFFVDADILAWADVRELSICPTGQIGCDPLSELEPVLVGTQLLSNSSDSEDDGDAYCNFGQRLITEAEWEFVATGGGTRLYPWGDEPPSCDRAFYSGCVAENPLHRLYQGIGVVFARPGSYPPSAEGVFDLAGNVPQRVAPSPGVYVPGYTALPVPASQSVIEAECNMKVQVPFGCRYLAATRGGDASATPEFLRSPYRYAGALGTTRWSTVRCARSAE
jgi:hypothetical protein